MTTFRLLATTSEGSDSTTTLSPLGHGGVPSSGVSAVVVDVGGEGATGGYAVVYPAGVSKPGTSALDYKSSQYVEAEVSTGVGSNGQFDLYNSSSSATTLFVDVLGYYTDATASTAGATFLPVNPCRIQNTTSVNANANLTLSPLGACGVPSSGVSAVAFWLGGEGATGGYAIAYPAGGTLPSGTSNLDFIASQYAENEVTVALGSNNQVTVDNHSSSSTTFFADVVGYYLGASNTAAGATFVPLTPARVLATTSVGSDATRNVTVLGAGGVPSTGVTAVVGDLGGDGATGYYAQAYPAGATRTSASALDLVGSQYYENHVTLAPGTSGQVSVYNNSSSSTTYFLDVTGYFQAAVAPAAPSGVTATAGTQQAAVSWTAPNDGGAAITSYTVTAAPGGAQATTTGTTSATVTGLTACTAYTFTVTATNVVGTGPASGASGSVTPYAAPDAPTGVTGQPGNQQATVSWTAPGNTNCSPITSYTVTASPGGAQATVTGSPPATAGTVTGLTNGTAYTFTVTATNAGGTSAASAASGSVTPAAVPDAPTGVTATAGDGQATVSWTAPSGNGSAITSYTVTASPGGAQATVTGSPPATTGTVTGLTDGTPYTFTVTATNAVGTGPASAASNSVTPVGPPAAPTSVTATAGDQQAAVSWTAPTSNGSPITSYTVTASPGGAQATVTGSPPATTGTVTGLVNGTGYTFTVTATNGLGTGPASAASGSVTPAAVPDAPTDVNATAGDGQATVSWTAPANNGSPITSYTVTSAPGGAQATVTGSPPATTGTVTGLTDGTGYTFTVTATNAVGTGPPSAASNQVTPVGAPGAPANVTGNPGNGQATVSWAAPANNGSAITSYTVTASPGGAQATVTGSPPATTAVVTGLTNGTGYTFTVTATNGIGTGPASAASATITPAAVPGAPTAITVTPGDGQLSVSWTAPANNGAAIASYTVTANPGGQQTTVTGSPPATTATVTGLTDGTGYTISVTATNAVGTGSAGTAATVITPAGVPSAPSDVTAAPQDGQALVMWNPPANNGATITGYTVTASPGGAQATVTGDPPAVSATVPGLTDGTGYTFTVTATNGIGASAASAASQPVTPANTGYDPGAVSTLAGSGSTTTSAGSASTAGFDNPQGVAVLGGYAYIADQDAISKVDLTTGATTVLAGQPGSYNDPATCQDTDAPAGSGVVFCGLTDIVTDGTYLYTVDNQNLRRTDPTTGATTTLYNTPYLHAVAVGPDGSLYVSTGDPVYDNPGQITEVNPTTQVASGYYTFPASTLPYGITADSQSLWVITRTAPSQCNPACTSQIEQLPLSGTVTATTLVTDGQLSTQANLTSVNGYLYTGVTSALLAKPVVLRQYNKSDGSYLDAAGADQGYQDGTGSNAWLGSITGVAADSSHLYLSDAGGNNRVRLVAAATPLPTGQPAVVNGSAAVTTGAVATLAGSGSASTSAGSASTAGFDDPQAVTVIGGYAYVADQDAISKVNLTTGATTVLAGQPGSYTNPSSCQDTDATVGSQVVFCGLTDIVTDGSYLYTVDGSFLRRTDPSSGATSTVYSTPYMNAVTVGPDGSLYVTVGNFTWDDTGQVLKVNPTSGTAAVYYNFPANELPYGVAADAQNLWVLTRTIPGQCGQCTVQIEGLPLAGTVTETTLVTGSGLDPGNLTSAGGYLYVGLEGSRQVGNTTYTGLLSVGAVNKTTGVISAVAGGGPSIPLDGTGSAAAFASVNGVASDGTRLLVADGSTGTGNSDDLLRLVLAVKSPLAAGGPTLAGEMVAAANPSEITCPCQRSYGGPVDSETGAQWEQATDLTIPGRGLVLDWARSYDSAQAAVAGPLGYGWSFSYGMHLQVDPNLGSGALATSPVLDVVQENGSQVAFVRNPDGSYSAAGRVLATLTRNGDGSWTFVRRARTTFTFNSSGQLADITDLNGYTTTLGYNGSGQLVTVTDPAGRQLTVTWSNGLISSVTDPAGRVVGYGYDGNGNLTAVTDPAGNITRYGYNPAHELTSLTDPRGHTTTTSYLPDGMVASQTDPMNRTTSFGYSVPTAAGSGVTTITDPNGNVTQDSYSDGELTSQTRGLGTSSQATWSYGYDPVTAGQTSMTDPNGHTWTYSYDTAGDRLTATDPLGHGQTWTYDNLGEVTTSTDPNGVTTTYSYDPNGNLLTVATPLSGTSQTATTSYGYGDPSHPGDVTAVTDPLGKTTRRSYDSYGQLTSTTDPLGNTTSYNYGCTGGPSAGCYPNIGWVYSTVSPRGNAPGANPADFTTSYSYDPNGRKLTVTDPLGHVTGYSYDPDGNLASVTDPDRNTTSYGYDADNELTVTTRADNTTLQASYDPDGNVTEQIDGANHTTTYGYDALNRVITVTDPLNRTTGYGYDPAGNRTTLTDPAGQVTTYGYDKANRLTSISYSDGSTPNVTFGYDKNGNRTSMVDGTGTSSFVYDSLGRLTKSTNGAGAVVGYGYDLRGDLTAITYPNGQTVTRLYDDAGQLVQVTDWLTNITAFSYDPDGNLVTITHPNGVIDTSTFNGADQLTAITDTLGTGTLASFDYARDNAGLLTATTPTGTGQTNESYAYSPLNQLTSYDTTAGNGSYGYDPAGNLTGLPDGTTLGYDNANEVTSSTPPAGAATAFSYNSRGDRVTATTGGAATSYGYDQANRLISYTAPGGNTTASYAYDGTGLRASKTVTTGGTPTTSQYTWDQSGQLPLLLTDGATNYLYGPGNLPIEQIGADGTAIYLHHDQLGSTVLLTNAAGQAVGSYSYTPFGAIASHAGAATTALLFGGEYLDAETGLYYLRARYYDPATGQFLTRDPLASLTAAPYAYVGDDPLNGTDPLGLCWPSWACGVEHAIGGAATTAVNFVGGVAQEGAHLAVDAVTDPFYLSYWGALDLNGAIHAGLGDLFGDAGCDIANVIGAPLVPIQAVGLGVDVGGDWIKEHLLGVPNYTVGDEGIPNAYLLGSQVGPLARDIGINWRHDFPGVHANGRIDWWW